jgi:hypothetical protein
VNDGTRLPAGLSALSAWLIIHQSAVFFSQTKSVINNQPAVLFFSAKTNISHQPNEQSVLLSARDPHRANYRLGASAPGSSSRAPVAVPYPFRRRPSQAPSHTQYDAAPSRMAPSINLPGRGVTAPYSLFARLISHQPAVLFSQNEPATSNQPQPASSTLLSEQTSTSHQPPANRTGCFFFDITVTRDESSRSLLVVVLI